MLFEKVPNHQSFQDWKGTGWYRMVKPAGTQLPEMPPPENHCGTHAVGYLRGSHPSEVGKRIRMTVCFGWGGHNCRESYTITVINCNGYFVYYLPRTNYCTLGYCAE